MRMFGYARVLTSQQLLDAQIKTLRTIQLTKAALVPLYVQFVNTYHFKMLDYEEFKLADDLKYWRDRLLSISL